MEPNEFAQPVSAELARVLAEAAGGFVNEGLVYFVASVQKVAGDTGGPYNVSGPYVSYDEGASVMMAFNLVEEVEGQPPTYQVFGPFDTTRDIPVALSTQVPVESFEVFPASPNPQSFSIAGSQYDAMFLTISAVTKFAVPYYTRVYGTDFANQVIENFQQSSLALMVHFPWTEYTDLGVTGQSDMPTFIEADGTIHSMSRPGHVHAPA